MSAVGYDIDRAREISDAAAIDALLMPRDDDAYSRHHAYGMANFSEALEEVHGEKGDELAAETLLEAFAQPLGLSVHPYPSENTVGAIVGKWRDSVVDEYAELMMQRDDEIDAERREMGDDR